MKPHIGIFGRRNYGKSSLVNYLVGQQVAIARRKAGIGPEEKVSLQRFEVVRHT